MVPNDWKVYELNDLCHKISVGLAISVTPFMRSVGTKLIRNQNIKRNYFNSDSVVYIDNDFAESNKSKRVKSGDVVAVRTGSNIGEACVVPKDFDGALTFTTLIARPNPKFLDSYFLSTHMNSEIGISEVNRLCAGGGKPNLNSGELKHYRILAPTLLEQKKITQILSTWDQAISATEKLLEKSQQQKKALMQQLLTGKKRFIDKGKSYSFITPNGYFQSKLGELPSDWKVELIKNHLWFQEGPGVRNYQFREEGIKLLNGTNIQFNQLKTENTDTYISEEEAFGVYKHFLIDEGDLLIACSGISIDRFDEKIAFVSSSHLPLCMNTSTMRFKKLDSGNVSITYFKYFMQSPYFKNQIRRQATGSAQLNFGPSHVAQCYVVVPPYEEQLKIVSVLRNADNQIDTLQKKLDRLKQEKKALMQQLLTGKKRVKVAA